MKIFKCPVCGNVVYLLDEKSSNLICCGKNMILLKENEIDGIAEKHVPVYEIKDNNISITVGSVKHVMEEDHYIEFIMYVCKENVFIKYLKPFDEPKAIFPYLGNGVIYEYCNKHGLWKKNMN